MKSDITFLPERKQRDLHELVALIREEIRDVVMIILYGSYAKNTYVDLDERHDFGVRTYYMSDYDLLVVTQRRLGVREATVNARIKERFSALATDALRAKLLEKSGYAVDVAEFVDFENSPKNMLIRAVRRKPSADRFRTVHIEKEIAAVREEFGISITLEKLLCE